MIIDLLWSLREKILNLPKSKIVYEKNISILLKENLI